MVLFVVLLVVVVMMMVMVMMVVVMIIMIMIMIIMIMMISAQYWELFLEQICRCDHEVSTYRAVRIIGLIAESLSVTTVSIHQFRLLLTEVWRMCEVQSETSGWMITFLAVRALAVGISPTSLGFETYFGTYVMVVITLHVTGLRHHTGFEFIHACGGAGYTQQHTTHHHCCEPHFTLKY